MQKIFFVMLILGFSCVGAFAHGGNDLIIHGYIVDNMSAAAHKADLASFVKTHDKTCLLKPSCMQSGYSIFSLDDGKLYAFDKASNEEAANFLKSPLNRTDVVIIAEKNGDALMVEHFANRRIVR